MAPIRVPPHAREARTDMPDPAAGTSGTPSSVTPEAAMAAVAQMRAELRDLDKHTDTAGKERHILDRNFKLRRKNAELEAQIATLNAAKPADGSLVLSKDDATIWTDFKKLNLKPAEITTLVTEHGTFKQQIEARTAEELFADAAEALEFKNLPLFVRTMTREGLHLEFKDVQVKDEESGKMVSVSVPMVRPKADSKAQLEALDAYLEREVPELIDVLQADAPGGASDDEASDDRSTGDDESFARRVARLSQGDATARRAAGRSTASNGVAIPVTRGARPSSGASRHEKKDREAIEEKAKNPIYAGL